MDPSVHSEPATGIEIDTTLKLQEWVGLIKYTIEGSGSLNLHWLNSISERKDITALKPVSWPQI